MDTSFPVPDISRNKIAQDISAPQNRAGQNRAGQNRQLWNFVGRRLQRNKSRRNLPLKIMKFVNCCKVSN